MSQNVKRWLWAGAIIAPLVAVSATVAHPVTTLIVGVGMTYFTKSLLDLAEGFTS